MSSQNVKRIGELNSKNLEYLMTCLNELRGNSGTDYIKTFVTLESHISQLLANSQQIAKEIDGDAELMSPVDPVPQKTEEKLEEHVVVEPTIKETQEVEKKDVEPPKNLAFRQRDRFTVVGLSQPEYKRSIETQGSLEESEDMEKVRLQIKSVFKKVNAKINEIAIINQKGVFEFVPKVLDEHKTFLCITFKVTKYDPHSILTKRTRVWSVDCFSRKISSRSGSATKEYSIDDIYALEKNLNDPCVCLIGFSKVTHDFELIFESTKDRQVFYELCYASRRTTIMYCPKYAPQDKPLCRLVLIDKKGVVKVNVTPEVTEPLTVFTMTWYMHSLPPTTENKPLKDLAAQNLDIYAFAIQTGPKGMLQYLEDVMGKDYTLISYESHWSVKLIIFIKTKHLSKVSNLERAAKNFTSDMDPLIHTYKLQNTGSIAVSFKVLDTSFCFISCELFGHNNIKLKQSIFCDMYNNFRLGKENLDLSQFDNLFWMGNFDMYLNWNESHSLQLCSHIENLPTLLSKDPILNEMEARHMFSGLQEGTIKFLPTSRWNKKENTYEKKFVPSFPDRVFYKGNTCKLVAYDSIPQIDSSIHLPVYATFQVDVQRVFSSLFSDNVERVIFVRDLAITDRIDSMGVLKKPQVNVFGDFLTQSPFQSSRNGKSTPLVNPSLKNLEIPVLRLYISNQEYLERRSLMIQVIDLSRSIYLIGTARLEIPTKCFSECVKFSIPMQFGTIFSGNLTGTIECKVLIQ